MRLLIVTQVVDRAHPVLGFFHEWISELARHFEHIEVICLQAGNYSLPENVRVHSLGKERGEGSSKGLGTRLQYALRFLSLVWRLRSTYDATFVHMNQEYLLLAGPFWKVFGKPAYLWRNHYAGSLLTDIAAFFCTKVFCTSRHSYTAKYAKTVLMPVGVDMVRFRPGESAVRKEHSILFLARMAPSKNPDMLLEALHTIAEQGIAFTATFVGSPLLEHKGFYKELIKRSNTLGLEDRVTFVPGVPPDEAVAFYQSHEIFVNCSRSGMFDKTLFEAAACGCVVLATSTDFKDAAGDEYFFTESASLAARLSELVTEEPEMRERRQIHMAALCRGESLTTLADRLVEEIQGK